jgi:hypothetical protein
MLDNKEGKKCNLLAMSQQNCNLPFKYYKSRGVWGGFDGQLERKDLKNKGKRHIG